MFTDARVGLTYSRRWVNHWVEDMSRDNAQSFFLGNPGYGIASDFPKVERRYDAGTLFFTKAFSRNWLAQVSYTLSYLRGNHSGFFAPETGDLLPGHEANFDIKNLTVNRNGPLPGDRRHNLKAYAARDWNLSPAHRIGTGLAAYAYSGEPTNYLGAHPLYGGGQTYILPRGSGERLPWNYGLDLQLAYRFAWSRGVTMSLTADVFNVINFQNVTARDQNYTDLNVYPIENGTKADLPNLVNADTGATVAPQREPPASPRPTRPHACSASGYGPSSRRLVPLHRCTKKPPSGASRRWRRPRSASRPRRGRSRRYRRCESPPFAALFP